MVFKKNVLLVCLLLCYYFPAFTQTKTRQLVSSSKADTWVATDELGRNINTNANGIRTDKYVGIFYFVWHGAHGYDQNTGSQPDEGVMSKKIYDTASPYNITQLLAANPTNPQYGPLHAFHYWSEPYFGYYLPDDEWIIRKHAQMLSDAGVDVIILDVTNAAIYLPQVSKIATTYLAMRKEGASTPSIAFIVNSQPGKTVQRLYKNIYQKNLFNELWFYWKGKPLLLCPPEAVTPEIDQFFTTRQSWAWSKDQKWFADGKDKWPWLDHTPQGYGWHESKDKPEQISVAIAEHPISNIGRSFHDGKEPEAKRSAEGLYFNEQWERALEVDPEFVFVTGWNEWVAMRFNDGAAREMLGKPIQKGETYFVDLYNEEYSRDAEPVKGSFNDNYYYQLVYNIRKFKGARSILSHTETATIKVDGRFDDWKKVRACYLDDRGDVFHRKHAGWGRVKEYINNTGRNDIVASKIISDKEHVYFYLQTAEKLEQWNVADYMQLFIGVVGNKESAWNSFHYVVNWDVVSGSSASLMRFEGNQKWQHIAVLSYKAKGNELEICIPKKLLGIDRDNFTVDFKWTDNSPVLKEANVMNWLDKGDAAPNGRFAYRYTKN